MPTDLSLQSIFQIVSEEQYGFKFGKPDRTSEQSLACILPILRETSQKRQYITYPETDQVLAHDSGTINKINLLNSSKENVFVRSGTIFEGKGTQSRALTRSAVLFPNKAVALEVRCVHASHGIRQGNNFSYGGITPLDVDTEFYRSGYAPSDQHTMWNSVSSTSRRMRSSYSTLQRAPQRSRRLTATSSRSSMNTLRGHADIREAYASMDSHMPDDNLKKNFDEFAKNFEEILSKARLHDNQVGLGLITDKGVKTIELFDLPASWEAIHKDAVKRMGTELLRGPDNTSVFEYKAENAVNAVKAVLGLPFKSNLIYEHKPSNGEPPVSIFGLTAQRFTGEVVEVDNRVVHLVILETV